MYGSWGSKWRVWSETESECFPYCSLGDADSPAKKLFDMSALSPNVHLFYRVLFKILCCCSFKLKSFAGTCGVTRNNQSTKGFSNAFHNLWTPRYISYVCMHHILFFCINSYLLVSRTTNSGNVCSTNSFSSRTSITKQLFQVKLWNSFTSSVGRLQHKMHTHGTSENRTKFV